MFQPIPKVEFLLLFGLIGSMIFISEWRSSVRLGMKVWALAPKKTQPVTQKFFPLETQRLNTLIRILTIKPKLLINFLLKLLKPEKKDKNQRKTFNSENIL